MPPKRFFDQTPEEQAVEFELHAFSLEANKGVDYGIRYTIERLRKKPEEYALQLRRLRDICRDAPLQKHIDALDALIRDFQDPHVEHSETQEMRVIYILARADAVLNRNARGFARESLGLLKSVWDRTIAGECSSSMASHLEERIVKLKTAFPSL